MENSNSVSNLMSYDSSLSEKNQPSIIDDGRLNYELTSIISQSSNIFAGCDLDNAPLEITLSDVIKGFDEIISQYSKYLNKDKIYQPLDSEWGKISSLQFDEWLQSCNVLFYYRGGQWDYHIFAFHSERLPNVELIVKNLTHDKLNHHVIPSVNTQYQSQIIYDWCIENHLIGRDTIEEIIMKYSPLDLTAYMGVEKWLELLECKSVEQKRCIKFNIKKKGFVSKKNDFRGGNIPLQTTIRDIHGLNSKSLAKQASSVGVKLLAKNSMDDYKSDMVTGYTNKPITGTLYNIADVLGTMETMLAYIPLLNRFTETMGISQYLKFDMDNLPYTGGAMVAKLIDTLLEYAPRIIADLPLEYRKELFEKGLVADFTNFTCSEDELLTYRLALRRFPVQSPTLRQKDIKLYNQVVHVMSYCETLEDYKNAYVEIYNPKIKKKVRHYLHEFLLSDKWKYMVAYDNKGQCSAKAFGLDTLTTLPFQAITQGGRCHNSNPASYRAVGLIGDSDMPGAYVTTLRKKEKCIGLPTTLQKNRNNVGSPEDRLLTPLIKALKRKGELRDNLWVADISTLDILNYDQDLIYSSLDVNERKINKSVLGIDVDDVSTDDKEPDDISKIASTMSLEINRIVHGKLTRTSYDVISKVSSNKEKSDFNNKVYYDSFVYFANSDRFENPIKWAKEILKSPVSVVSDKNGKVVDERSRAYFPFPLEIFIGKLADERKIIKKQRNNNKENPQEYSRLDAIQEFYKLVCNTAYGVFASVYFNISDSVVANNITDTIRTNMWLKSKAIRTYQEITDGGWYDLLQMPSFSGSRPTMHTFSKWERWRNSNNGKSKMTTEGFLGQSEETLTALFDEYTTINNLINEALNLPKTAENKERINTLKTIKSDWESYLDNNIEQYIIDFWSPYGIVYTAGVEHKTSHYSWKAAYNGKGNYIFESITEGVLKPSRRGARYLGQDLIEQGYKDNPALLELEELLVYGEYKNFDNADYDVFNLVKLGEWLNAPEDSEIRTKLPGQALIKHREPRQINNSHVRMTSSKDSKGRVTHLSDTIYNRKTQVKGERTQMFSRYVEDGADVLYTNMNDNHLPRTNL